MLLITTILLILIISIYLIIFNTTNDTIIDNPDTIIDNPDTIIDNPDTIIDNPDTIIDNPDTTNDTIIDNPDTTNDTKQCPLNTGNVLEPAFSILGTPKDMIDYSECLWYETYDGIWWYNSQDNKENISIYNNIQINFVYVSKINDTFLFEIRCQTDIPINQINIEFVLNSMLTFNSISTVNNNKYITDYNIITGDIFNKINMSSIFYDLTKINTDNLFVLSRFTCKLSSVGIEKYLTNSSVYQIFTYLNIRSINNVNIDKVIDNNYKINEINSNVNDYFNENTVYIPLNVLTTPVDPIDDRSIRFLNVDYNFENSNHFNSIHYDTTCLPDNSVINAPSFCQEQKRDNGYWIVDVTNPLSYQGKKRQMNYNFSCEFLGYDENGLLIFSLDSLVIGTLKYLIMVIYFNKMLKLEKITSTNNNKIYFYTPGAWDEINLPQTNGGVFIEYNENPPTTGPYSSNIELMNHGKLFCSIQPEYENTFNINKFYQIIWKIILIDGAIQKSNEYADFPSGIEIIIQLLDDPTTFVNKSNFNQYTNKKIYKKLIDNKFEYVLSDYDNMLITNYLSRDREKGTPNDFYVLYDINLWYENSYGTWWNINNTLEYGDNYDINFNEQLNNFVIQFVFVKKQLDEFFFQINISSDYYIDQIRLDFIMNSMFYYTREVKLINADFNTNFYLQPTNDTYNYQQIGLQCKVKNMSHEPGYYSIAQFVCKLTPYGEEEFNINYLKYQIFTYLKIKDVIIDNYTTKIMNNRIIDYNSKFKGTCNETNLISCYNKHISWSIIKDPDDQEYIDNSPKNYLVVPMYDEFTNIETDPIFNADAGMYINEFNAISIYFKPTTYNNYYNINVKYIRYDTETNLHILRLCTLSNYLMSSLQGIIALNNITPVYCKGIGYDIVNDINSVSNHSYSIESLSEEHGAYYLIYKIHDSITLYKDYIKAANGIEENINPIFINFVEHFHTIMNNLDNFNGYQEFLDIYCEIDPKFFNNEFQILLFGINVNYFSAYDIESLKIDYQTANYIFRDTDFEQYINNNEIIETILDGNTTHVVTNKESVFRIAKV